MFSDIRSKYIVKANLSTNLMQKKKEGEREKEFYKHQMYAHMHLGYTLTHN